MNKRVTPLTALILALGFCHAAAADDFKCFVETVDGAQHIVFSQTDTVESARAAAQVKRIHRPDNTYLAVRNVLECRPLESSFLSAAARRIERQTPR